MELRIQTLNQDDLYYCNEELEVAISYKKVIENMNSKLKIQFHRTKIEMYSGDNCTEFVRPHVYFLGDIAFSDNWKLVSKKYLMEITEYGEQYLINLAFDRPVESNKIILNEIESSRIHRWVWNRIRVMEIPDKGEAE